MWRMDDHFMKPYDYQAITLCKGICVVIQIKYIVLPE